MVYTILRHYSANEYWWFSTLTIQCIIIIWRNREPSQEKRPYWNPKSKRIFGLRLHFSIFKATYLMLSFLLTSSLLSIIIVLRSQFIPFEGQTNTCGIHHYLIKRPIINENELVKLKNSDIKTVHNILKCFCSSQC